MQFYKIFGYIQDKEWVKANGVRETYRKNARTMARKTLEFDTHMNRSVYYFVTDIDDDEIACGAIVQDPDSFEKNMPAFFHALKLKVEDLEWTEITMDALSSGLSHARRNGYLEEDDDEVIEDFGIISNHPRFLCDVDFEESILKEVTDEEMCDIVNDYLLEDTLDPELRRIYNAKTRTKAYGHPVHYMIETDNRDVERGICDALLTALYKKNRIVNKRYCIVKNCEGDDFSSYCMNRLYHTNVGGTVIIRYIGGEEDEGEFASTVRENIKTIAASARKHRNSVLTIVVLPRECTKIKELFEEFFAEGRFVEFREDIAVGIDAENYLRMLAREAGIRTDKRLFGMLDEKKGYLSTEIREIFEEWYDTKLRTSIYPQYKSLAGDPIMAKKEKHSGCAYDTLMSMIGLTEAKSVINKALDYYKAQKLFKEKGMKTDRPAMHMVFTGNPGSAKTTCARLFAQIMKDNGLVSKGHIVEVGRADLVGKYVGHTAPQVKSKFEQAKGGILFIDEAYSLVDDKNGMFGDEAINTIVQEMENLRNEVVVIFAGYPDKMEEFLNKNPGLRSRIAFHVPFEDYNVTELCDIAGLMAKDKGLSFTPDAVKKLGTVFGACVNQKDFGNGRLVRNVLESARMAQASRLLKKDYKSVTKADVATITAEDIEEPILTSNTEKHGHIGFCA